jgi:DNA-directed RNA polymerase specialized sigma24 family protein
MPDDDSVTEWILQLQDRNAAAAQQLWGRYVERLVRLARRKMGSAPRRAADEEDVVVSIFDAAFRGIQAGRFAQLSDRHDLWQILVMLTERKAIDLKRRERAVKRGRGQIRGESALLRRTGGASDGARLSQFAGRECTPEFAIAACDHLKHLLDKLPDNSLRDVALGKLAGDTNEELSERLGLSLRAVERKLNLIRREWESGVLS